MAGSTLVHRIVIIVVCLVLMVFLHVVVAICAMLFRARPSRRVAEHAGEEEGGGGAGLTADELGQLPCHEFKEGAGNGAECAVCLDGLRSGDRCRVLPRCGHRFHADCLDSWLRKSRRCPVCRTEAIEQRKDAPRAVAATVEIVSEV